MRQIVGASNLGLAFVLELGMLAAFAWTALRLDGLVGYAVAGAAVAVAVGLWALLAAPKSSRSASHHFQTAGRLRRHLRIQRHH